MALQSAQLMRSCTQPKNKCSSFGLSAPAPRRSSPPPPAAANALPLMTAMKQADPMAKIGVPWALEPSETSGAGFLNSVQRIRTTLQQNNLTAAGFVVGRD